MNAYYEKILENADKLKTYGDAAKKAGCGMKMAAILGYKAGYSIGKHPMLERAKKTIERHPGAGLIALLGIFLSVLGLTGFLVRQRA